MTSENPQETPEQRKKRLAAARQARYVAKQRAAGLVVGATVRRDLIDAVTPQVIRALDAGQPLGPALNEKQKEAGRLGLKVQKILAAGGLKAKWLRFALDL